MKLDIIFILLIAVLFNAACGGGKNKTKKSNQKETFVSAVGMGCEMKQEVYDRAMVFEPLAKESKKYHIPSRVSLEKYAPTPKNQGAQGSCVGFSSCYAARSILYSIATGKDPNEVNFSPAYVYNQIKVAGCTEGSYILDAMNKLRDEGVLPLSEFPYNENDCNKLPTNEQKQKAGAYKTLGYTRLTKSDNNYEIDLEALKQNVAQGSPVVLAMPVGGSFYELRGKKIWRPNQSDWVEINRYKNRQPSKFGGHAMCLIGYDDNLEGGCVQIMNSWGTDFGENGFFWMTYNDFLACCREAYALHPMGSIKIDDNNNVEIQKTPDFEAEIALYVKKEKAYFPLKYKSGYTFATPQRMPKNTRFKIELTNNSVCYAYVIGQETDGSSYILFPYTKKHSPYFGITGTRLFPKEESMRLDEIGNKDYMAIILSKDELNIQEINERISKSTAPTYEQRIREVLQQDLIPIKDIQFEVSADGVGAKFSANSKDKNALFMVIEINKQ
ncbi:MAG: peptidase C1 [Bacteroidia bacterium]|nr:peptidase C1 [Bacteroidia bacterium]MDW8345785.1 C1 family peptidase [Bacteroidia bacterium]